MDTGARPSPPAPTRHYPDPWSMARSVQQKEPQSEIQKAQSLRMLALERVTLGKSLPSVLALTSLSDGAGAPAEG